MISSLKEVSVKKVDGSVNFKISHRIQFDISREDDWPDSLPWPEWKPVTDKAYQPEKIYFTIDWLHGETPKISSYISVTGPRILKNGSPGTEVRCQYYGSSGLPESLSKYVDEAQMVAMSHAERFESREI